MTGTDRTYLSAYTTLAIAVLAAFLLDMGMGAVRIGPWELVQCLLGSAEDPERAYIVTGYRLPKALTAIAVGAGLSLCGLLMQTVFQNALAGPFVLGVSSGAGLGAALFFLGGGILAGSGLSGAGLELSLVAAACLGAFSVLGTVLLAAARVRDTLALLIIGLMFGSLTGAVVTLLSYFSSAAELQRYVFWTFGGLGNLRVWQIGLLWALVIVGAWAALRLVRGLDPLLMGRGYAISMGVNPDRTGRGAMVVTGILAGTITAFVGPIAFIGLAVPHLVRQRFGTVLHRHLVPATLLYGAALMLLCDALTQWPGAGYILPINAITSIIGAPVVIWILVGRKSIRF